MAEEQRFDFTAPKHIIEEAKRTASDAAPAQQPSYQRKKRLRTFSPERTDAFNQDDPGSKRSYADIIQQHQQEKERSDTLQKLKRDERPPDSEPRSKAEGSDHATSASEWDSVPAPRKKPVIWDTPDQVGQDTPTPGRWSADTPTETPRGGSMWDVMPGEHTPSGTPPAPNVYTNVTPQQLQMLRISKEIEARNKPWTDQELNDLLPIDGYEIVQAPEHYRPVKNRSHTPAPFFTLPEDLGKQYDVPGTPASGPGALPQIKPEDLGYFGALLQEVDFDALTLEEQKERRIMEILLKVKNGTPIMRKAALRQITERARELGPGPIFSQILPLMMSTTLEDHERHLLVKVIDRVLFKLDDLVRPYVHKILVVIEPMLIEEDYYARVEGREIVSSLAKAAGLPTMIATMRPDIDHADEYVRNTTARAFAVVASALGVSALLPFLKAVCSSKKSWLARHTGVKIVQQIAILMGCAILPYLKQLVEIVEGGLKDEQNKVRTITALAIAALAEAAAPYGVEAFESILIPLWEGIKAHKQKILAAFLKAIGFIIPLMDEEHAGKCTRQIMPIVVREFQSEDDEMKKIVLKVLKQCVTTEGVSANYVREIVIMEFFKQFWTRRMALDRRNAKQLVETTVALANKVGCSEIVTRVVSHLKDDSEPFRKMAMETIERIIVNLGAADINSRLEEQVMDGILYAFQEQSTDDSTVILSGFGTFVSSLGLRAKPYISQICGTIQWRLNNKSPRVRMQAADLVARIAEVMKVCGEEALMGRLGVVFFECLGEEYPEVLGSVLAGLKAIVNVIGMTKMTPPIKDLLPRLTPILRNRHEKVQENVIDLIGRIADRGFEYVNAKEWMRICFDLLELLRAHKKGIRRATVNTFGYIAKAIGPHDVLGTLLNNLKVQERQNRVCTTVAIAIVAETCGPFTVIPALMNEYRVPEMNVQNGVLKSFAFMFEYIGEMAKDYIYAVIPLLEDALIDRDLVHRQTACATIKHLALGVVGLGCEDALTHLLNFVWPNIFETSPHVINAVIEATDGLRVGLGVGRMMLYVIQGLFHPARRVREVYWRVYNLLYLGNQDALVMYYPRLPDDEHNSYRRTELELFI
jgi:splicing factor 3B subunit 1